MDSFLVCKVCKELFNNEEKVPKVLPCSDVTCLKCLYKISNYILGEYILNCSNCNKSLKLVSLDELPTSKLTLHLINQNQENVKHLKNFILNPNSEIFEINKHYDEILNSIDIRTESLISFLCTSRELLFEQVNEHRKKSVSFYKSKSDDTEIFKLKTLLENGLNELANCSKFNKEQVLNLLSIYDKIEAIKYDNRKSLWYFDENSIKNDKSMLGFLLNKNLDRNYFKIKNLNIYLSLDTNNIDESQINKKLRSDKVRLLSPNTFVETAIRQHILPISRKIIIKVYFTTKRSLYIESFDSNGKFIKSILAFKNLSSFPISYAYGDHLCLSFTAKSQNNASIFDSNQTFFLLFNSNLECLKVINKFTSIESIYMNEKNIFIFYANKLTSCCEVLDYELNEVNSFGQQTDPEQEFYMEKTNLPWKEQTSSGLKNNPRIFGCTDSYIYMYNINKMMLMDRKTGDIKKTISSNGDPAYYLLDSQSNIIKVNGLCKRIALINLETDLFIQSKYLDCLDDVHLTYDDYLVFVDKNKEFVIFV